MAAANVFDDDDLRRSGRRDDEDREGERLLEHEPAVVGVAAFVVLLLLALSNTDVVTIRLFGAAVLESPLAFVVFVAFGVTGPIPPTELGVTLALAVLLDATVIRMMLVPALLAGFLIGNRLHAALPAGAVLKAVVSQRLLPRRDLNGRTVACEIMINTPSIRTLIRDNKTFRINSDIQTGAKYGMVTLDGFLMEKYQLGYISREEVITKSQDPVTIQSKLQEYELARALGTGGGGAHVCAPA